MESIDHRQLDDELWAHVLAWYRDHGRHDLPWRHDRSPWRILMAEALLRRTRASSAANVFASLVSVFREPKDVVQNQTLYAEKIKSLGLALRSSLFVKACQTLCDKFGGRVPTRSDELLRLPGVGHYSRDAILNFGFDEPRYLIDANTIRLAARFTGEDIDQTRHRSTVVRTIVGKFLGPESRMTPDRNFALLDLAAIVCSPKRPKCELCPLKRSCYYFSIRSEESAG